MNINKHWFIPVATAVTIELSLTFKRCFDTTKVFLVSVNLFAISMFTLKQSIFVPKNLSIRNYFITFVCYHLLYISFHISSYVYKVCLFVLCCQIYCDTNIFKLEHRCVKVKRTGKRIRLIRGSTHPRSSVSSKNWNE